jgi:digeranylgeranylglycerophospholipid reductase
MVNSYDVVIIGAGIAGLFLARELGKSSLKICLIDSKADPANVTFYTLGSFIDLDRYGISNQVIAAEISEGHFHSKHIHFQKKGKGYILNKKRLYQEILDKIDRSNVEIRRSTHIKGVNLNSSGEVDYVTDEKGGIYKAKIFVDATGTEGFLSKRFGLQDKHFNIAEGLEYNVEYKRPQNQVHLFIGNLFRGGYAWIFPFGDNRAIFGYGTFNLIARSEIKKRLDSAFDDKTIRQLVIKDNEQLSGGTIPITDVKTKFVYKNVVCVGDSVSQVNPIVGEGHKFIMEACLIAASYIQKAFLGNNIEILTGYEQEWCSKFYQDYVLSKHLQISADRYSKSDLLCDIAASLLLIKRDKTMMKLLSGEFTKKDIYLP